MNNKRAYCNNVKIQYRVPTLQQLSVNQLILEKNDSLYLKSTETWYDIYYSRFIQPALTGMTVLVDYWYPNLSQYKPSRSNEGEILKGLNAWDLRHDINYSQVYIFKEIYHDDNTCTDCNYKTIKKTKL